MKNLTLEEYYKLIPEETKNYIEHFFSCFDSYNDTYILVDDERIEGEKSKLMYKFLAAYKKLSGEKTLKLKEMGFKTTTDDMHYDYSFSDSYKEGLFRTYYSYLVPTEDKSECCVLIPEDIIGNVIKRLKENNMQLYAFFSGNWSEFLTNLNGEAKKARKKVEEKEMSNVFKNAPIHLINYYETASRIYNYLNSKKNEIKNLEATDENLIALSFTLAMFHYNHVSVHGSDYNEKDLMVSYFNSIGLSKESLERKIGVSIPNLNSLPKASLKVLKGKLNVDLLNSLSAGEHDIKSVFKKIIVLDDDYYGFKRVFNVCDLTVNNVLGYEEALANANNKSNIYEDTDLMPDVIELIHRINQIYTYLKTKINPEDNIFVANYQDLAVLAILLAAYEEGAWRGIQFFEYKGISLEKVLETVGLDNKEKFFEEVNKTSENLDNLGLFNDFVFGGISKSKPHSEIKGYFIYNNSLIRTNAKSSLVHKLYNYVTGEELKDNPIEDILAVLEKMDLEKKTQLKEELFKDVSIDVYNYLEVVSSYYTIFKNKNLSQEDAEQLSIIFAASRYEKRMEKYLNSLGLSRNQLANYFGMNFDYEKRNFDISAINGPLRKYIFDREPSQITVHSIFRNAFEPSLTNTVKLRQVLNKVNKTPEDFLDIDARLEEYDEVLKEKEKKESIRNAFKGVSDNCKSYMNDVLKVYDYLKENVKNSALLSKEFEYKKMAVLIVSLIENDEYKQYFYDNGLTLQHVLSLIDVTQDEINEALKGQEKEENILDFSSLVYQQNAVGKKDFVQFIFSGNDSFMNSVVETTNRNPELVKNAILNKQERDITPEEGIALLSDIEVVQIKDPTPTLLANYGSDISQHSKYISDALQKLMNTDSLESSVQGINNALSEVVTEEVIEPPKMGFFESLFMPEQKPQIIKRYNPEKVDTLSDSVDEQLTTLISELQGYEFIRRYIEEFLKKNAEQLKALKETFANLKEEEIADGDDLASFTRLLNQRTTRDILQSKINTLETNEILMKQELITVHRAIINHFVTINALQTSKSTIIPLLASEMAVGIGNKSEGEAIDLTSNLIGLFQSVVNKNETLAQQNLQRLQGTTLSETDLNALNLRIGAYLSEIERDNKLLGESSNKPIQLELTASSSQEAENE